MALPFQNAPVPVLRSDGKLNETVDQKSSAKDRADANVNDEKKKKSKMTLQNGQPVPVSEEEEPEKELLSESEKILAQRFKLYEACQKDIVQLLLFWDRIQLIQLPPPGSEEKQEEAEDQRQAPSGRKGRKDRERERQERLEKERAEKERLEKEKAERERLERLKMLEEFRLGGPDGEGGEGADRDVGIPCLEINVLSSEESCGKRILESGKLPDVDQVGPSGICAERGPGRTRVGFAVQRAQDGPLGKTAIVF